MLKTGNEGLINAIAAFLTDILNGSLEPSEDWKRAKLTLVSKSADPRMLENYRPISIIPVMTKLFSTVLYEKIGAFIDAKLNEEQFGLRRGWGCTDAVHIMRMVSKSLRNGGKNSG